MTMRVIVTGAGSGIGAATAAHFEQRGGTTARLGHSRIDQPLSFQCDVTDEASITTVIDAAALALGGVDAVAADSGITFHGTLEETTLDVWERLFAVNTRGVFLTARAAIAHLRATGGALVTIASQAVLVPQAGLAAYAASKAAVLAMTRSMVLDYAAEGLRINRRLSWPDAHSNEGAGLGGRRRSGDRPGGVTRERGARADHRVRGDCGCHLLPVQRGMHVDDRVGAPGRRRLPPGWLPVMPLEPTCSPVGCVSASPKTRRDPRGARTA